MIIDKYDKVSIATNEIYLHWSTHIRIHHLKVIPGSTTCILDEFTFACSHSSQVSTRMLIDSNVVTIPFFCKSLRSLKLRCPRWQCHVHYSLVDAVVRHLCFITFRSTLKVLLATICALRIKVPFASITRNPWFSM